jgi:hypothetical protein
MNAATEASAPPQEVFAISGIGADAAREWLAEAFAQQRTTGATNALSAAEQGMISRVLTLDWWHTVTSEEPTTEDGPAQLLTTLLPAAVRAAQSIPYASLILALYLRNLINEAWELSWDHTLTTVAVRLAGQTAKETEQSEAAGLAWRLLAAMELEFHVEAALLTGSIKAVIAQSELASGEFANISKSVDELPAQPGLATLRRESHNESCYYRVVNRVAQSSLALLERRSYDETEALDWIDAEIAAADFTSADASELRGHRASLATIGAASGLDWLHIDEGRLRVVYSFGILHPRPRESGEDLALLREVLDQRRVQRQRLGSLRINKVLRSLTLSDAWQGSDSLGRGYRGSVVELEDLLLEGEADEQGNREVLHVLESRVQFSELGNHAIVFSIDLGDCAAHEVAQAINLATPVFGNLTEIPTVLRLRPESAPDSLISRLADEVAAILDDLRQALRESSGISAGDAISARAGSFGVIVTVEAASRDQMGVRKPLHSASELRTLWGAQPLLHPLPGGASGIADWTMYNLEAAAHFNLLHLNDGTLSANANVSLLASFRSPDYAVQEIEDFLEFAHSMHGMYQAWQNAVRTHAELIASLLEGVDDQLRIADVAQESDDDVAQEEAVTKIGEIVRTIERTELALQSFVQSKQAIMLFIESPAIVTSPSLRIDLDTVLQTNRYAFLRDGFERAVRDVLGSRLQPLLEVCHQRIASLHESRQQARERKTERMAQVLGVILAVVGLSGLVQVAQSGFDLRGDITWWFLWAILALTLILGGAMLIPGRNWRKRRRRDKS